MDMALSRARGVGTGGLTIPVLDMSMGMRGVIGGIMVGGDIDDELE